MMRKKMSFADLHMHSTASDGTDTPRMLYENLKKNGITIFALTDHDTVGGVREMAACCSREPGVTFIPGIEFSCKTPVKKCHILGLNIDPENEVLLELIEKGIQLRKKKLERRLTFLKEVHGIEFQEETIEKLRGMDTVGKPHLAQEIIRLGKAETVGQAIAEFLKGCDTGFDDRLNPAEVIPAIRQAGGIPVWAHPLGGEGEKRLTREEVDAQLDLLCSYGLAGLECYYSRYTPEEETELLEKAAGKGLLVSGGSDYHGTVKNIALGTLCAEEREIPAEWLTVLEAIHG